MLPVPEKPSGQRDVKVWNLSLSLLSPVYFGLDASRGTALHNTSNPCLLPTSTTAVRYRERATAATLRRVGPSFYPHILQAVPRSLGSVLSSTTIVHMCLPHERWRKTWCGGATAAPVGHPPLGIFVRRSSPRRFSSEVPSLITCTALSLVSRRPSALCVKLALARTKLDTTPDSPEMLPQNEIETFYLQKDMCTIIVCLLCVQVCS